MRTHYFLSTLLFSTLVITNLPSEPLASPSPPTTTSIDQSTLTALRTRNYQFYNRGYYYSPYYTNPYYSSYYQIYPYYSYNSPYSYYNYYNYPSNYLNDYYNWYYNGYYNTESSGVYRDFSW